MDCGSAAPGHPHMVGAVAYLRSEACPVSLSYQRALAPQAADTSSPSGGSADGPGAGGSLGGALVYLGPISDATRLAVLDAFSRQPHHTLKEALATLGIDRSSCRQPRELAERLLSVPHAILMQALPEAAAAFRLPLPTFAEEAAALQALVQAARGEPPLADLKRPVYQQSMLGGPGQLELHLVSATHYSTVAAAVEMLLQRPLVPPGLSCSSAGAAGSGGGSSAASDDVDRAQVQQHMALLSSIVERAAALEGRAMSDLPPNATFSLQLSANAQLMRKMQSGEACTLAPGPANEFVQCFYSPQDLEQLRAAIRTLPLPPAPEVPRCAVCGAAEGFANSSCKLRACPCHLVHYCTTTCQNRHWPQHAAACKAARKAARSCSAGAKQ